MILEGEVDCGRSEVDEEGEEGDDGEDDGD